MCRKMLIFQLPQWDSDAFRPAARCVSVVPLSTPSMGFRENLGPQNPTLNVTFNSLNGILELDIEWWKLYEWTFNSLNGIRRE